MAMQLGIKHNQTQVFHWLMQVLFVGLTLGITRVAIPALADQEYAIAADSYLFLSTFVIAFGIVKGSLNFLAGYWAEHLGRKPVHLMGWLFGLPVPWLIWYAPSWNWIIFAMVLLGFNQGLCWSMTQTAKLDITHANERGLTIGLNEFAGYLGVAIGGLLTAYAVNWFGMRDSLLYIGTFIVLCAFVLSFFFVHESQLWLTLHHDQTPQNPLSLGQVFTMMSGGNRHLTAVVQAGCVEKFVDALVWIIWPIYLYQASHDLELAGWVISLYGLTWGIGQLFTGHWSDKLGRKRLNVAGMVICGMGALLLPAYNNALWWSFSAVTTGFGMALLYPNLSAAIVDHSAPNWRARAIGIYRFWRDFGYAVGALCIGVVSLVSGQLLVAFWFVGGCMLLSALWLYLASRDEPLYN
ncbi:MAG: MFS transporter [Gammaproteobacteria bacterium]|jgi:MFS family permease|nr:MFS transporter [Gammaproteobacteria bacterium]